MDAIIPLLTDPAAWAALITLIAMEVVLGIDNLIFISILSNKLPEAQRQFARRLGISLALIMRLALLSTLAWLVHLTTPIFSVGGSSGRPPRKSTARWIPSPQTSSTRPASWSPISGR